MPDYPGGCEMAECVCRRDPKPDGKKGFCRCVDNKGELLRALRWWKESATHATNAKIPLR